MMMWITEGCGVLEFPKMFMLTQTIGKVFAIIGMIE